MCEHDLCECTIITLLTIRIEKGDIKYVSLCVHVCARGSEGEGERMPKNMLMKGLPRLFCLFSNF